MTVRAIVGEAGWKEVYHRELPAREGKRFALDGLELHGPTRDFLVRRYPEGIYGHQREGIARFLEGRHVALATSTGSGKSLLFQAALVETLARDPKAKVLALYPLKALASEQEGRLREAMEDAGLSAKVGRVDGSVSPVLREDVLRDCNVVIATPDVLHAWLLPRADKKAVRNFLSRLSVVVMDEVHAYAGVFGSNMAFLLRRLRVLAGTLDASPQFLGASATIREGEEHLRKLTGLDFDLLDKEWDTSPSHGLTVRFIEPPQGQDLLDATAQLMEKGGREGERMLAFVDSRKVAEHIGSIFNRRDRKEGGLEKVLPYRSGYEAGDRQKIEQWLREGRLQGVVSTSALELGMDIPGLTLGLLVGAPQSATSAWQRMGRIGRHAPGEVLVLHDGSLAADNIFKDPERFFNLPPTDCALYLDNRRIQYIHAMCLMGTDGEWDKLDRKGNLSPESVLEDSLWPEGFAELCRRERMGDIPKNLQSMKMEAGMDPNRVFPLRDVEAQYQVEEKKGGGERLGTLSHGQLMREAYPGAVYKYLGCSYRVLKVLHKDHKVWVRREKQYQTRASTTPTSLYVQQGEDSGDSFRHGDLTATVQSLQVVERIAGYQEMRGPQKENVTYPLGHKKGIFYDSRTFNRNYFTTGALLFHPALEGEGVDRENLARLIFEAFLILCPMERQELNAGQDRLKTPVGQLDKDARFLAVFDQVYGSLHLSSRLLEREVLPRVLEKALELGREGQHTALNPVTLNALAAMTEAVAIHPRERVVPQDTGLMGTEVEMDSDARYVTVIQPGSKGMDRNNQMQEVDVEAVMFHPKMKGLVYRVTQGSQNGNAVALMPVSRLEPLPGESQLARYDQELGMLCPLEPAGV